jgi:hypothetical protein
MKKKEQLKNSLLEMMLKHEVGGEHNNDQTQVYYMSRVKWTTENGSCLDSGNYIAHWNKREDYAANMLCQYYKKHGYCVGCKNV